MRTSKKSFCFALLALSLCSRVLPLTHHSSFVINSADERNQLCLNFCTIILRNEVTIDRTAGEKMASPFKIASLCCSCDKSPQHAFWNNLMSACDLQYRRTCYRYNSTGHISWSCCSPCRESKFVVLSDSYHSCLFLFWMEHNGVPSHSDQSRNTRLQDIRLEREWAWKTLVGECLLPNF
jgi:hypothetical protein